ncbi:unnamed protein product [Taenia asiatica]|uniref:Phage protein n=1 Tax=Taenia asiatica TaxID=60517 RepID=A0A0R3WGI4_TAEAS|nr:unnamed protein product [Taenia asiatica]
MHRFLLRGNYAERYDVLPNALVVLLLKKREKLVDSKE